MAIRFSVVAAALLGLSACSGVVQASDVYIAQNASGANNGQSCSNAYDVSFFNNGGNWGPGSAIGPGTTVHLCGRFNAPAGSSGYLNVQGSGASGRPITIVAENSAVLTSPYWGTNGAISVNGGSFLVFDGGANGVIQATSNGTNLGNQQGGSGISIINCSNCQVKNWTISNIYVNVGPNDESAAGESTYGIYWVGGSNVSIGPANKIHDAKWCAYYAFPGSSTTSNVNVFSNNIYNCDHNIVVGSGNTGAILSGSNAIYSNVAHDWSNWDDVADRNHHDCIHFWAAHNGSVLSGMKVYDNYCYGNPGIHMTAHIYAAEDPGIVTGAEIFNNVMTNSSTVNAPGDGFVMDWGNNTQIYNNTMVGSTASNAGGSCILVYATGDSIKNNICSSVYVGIYVEPGASIGSSDYNDFYNMNSIAFSQSNWYSSLNSWTSRTGQDGHSTTGNPLLTGSFGLQSNSAALGGVDLSFLNVLQLDVDKSGLNRAIGGWNMGAYELTTATQPLAPPSSLTAQVN